MFRAGAFLKPEDRKLAWAAIVVIAVIGLEVAWYLFIGPPDSGPNQAAKQQQENLFLGLSAESWTAFFTAVLTASTILLWLSTRKSTRIAETTLTQLERPHLFIENVRQDDPRHALRNWFGFDEANLKQGVFTAVYDVVNYGRSPAIIKERYASIYIGSALPDVPTPNRNDVWATEIVMGEGQRRSGFSIFWPGNMTGEILNDLMISRGYDPDRTPTKVFFFAKLRYESVHGTGDEIGVIWEYLIDINQWVPMERENYTYRREIQSGSRRQRAYGRVS